jgi:hypothetical protein
MLPRTVSVAFLIPSLLSFVQALETDSIASFGDVSHDRYEALKPTP